MLNLKQLSESNQSPIKRVFIFLLVILFTGYMIFAFRIWDQVNDDVDSQLNFLNQLLLQNTQDTFKQHESVLRVLAERLLDLDVINHPDKARQLINNIHLINPTLAGFGVARPDGQLVIVSGVPANRKLPSLMAMKESAESFKQVLASDEMQTGPTYYLKLLKKWLIPIRLRVKNKDGSTAFVLSAGIDIDSVETTWNGIILPEGFKIHLLRNDGHWQFSRPINIDIKDKFYADKANNKFFDRISFLENKNIDYYHFEMDDQHFTGRYAKNAKLFSVASFSNSKIYEAFSRQMLTPTLLFLVFLAGGTLIFVLAVKDHVKHESTLIQKANYDDLTGLPNRTLARDRLQQEINLAERENTKVIVIFFDLDQFKRINDGFGHIIGDKLLQQCAERLRHTIRSVDTVARLSGDEFLFIIHSQKDLNHVEAIINKIQNNLSKAFLIQGNEIYMNSSMGVSIYPDDAQTVEKLLTSADTALYKAKESGRNKHCFYSSKMNDEMQRRIKLDYELRHALEKGEFYLAYQPKFDLRTMECVGAEALLRWKNANYGEISPVEFIPIAEDNGLINEIGEFVLNTACQDLQVILDKTQKPFSMALNISPIQLQKKRFVQHITETIKHYQLETSFFEFEITESTLIQNPEELHSLEAENINLAIDDFGTGFSSLSYLSNFPLSTLKIDRAFIRDIEVDKHDAQLVIAIINMGKSLELEVVAEGIETEAQLNFLRESGCHFGQGFFYSKPISLIELQVKYIK